MPWTATVANTKRAKTLDRLVVTVNFAHSPSGQTFAKEYQVQVEGIADSAAFKVEVDHDLAMLERVSEISRNAIGLTFSPAPKQRPVLAPEA
jgi:hypothetical protein